MATVTVETTDTKCVGCGGFVDYCGRSMCGIIRIDHAHGDHRSCDFFECDGVEWEDVS